MRPGAPVRNCYGYVRVSKNIQAEKGFSLLEQQERIIKYCEANGFNHVKTYVESGKSGTEKKRDKRLELAALLRDIPAGDTLVVVSLSRLTRSLSDFLKIAKELSDRKCPLIVIVEQINTGHAMGKFGAVVFAAVGELESDLIRQRGEDIKKSKQEKGEFIGKIPYGWKRLGDSKSPVVEIEEEQKVIAYIYDMASKYDVHSKRVHTNYAIAKKLNEIHVRPPGKSKEWDGTYITRILNRKSGPAVTKAIELKDNLTKIYSLYQLIDDNIHIRDILSTLSDGQIELLRQKRIELNPNIVKGIFPPAIERLLITNCDESNQLKQTKTELNSDIMNQFVSTTHIDLPIMSQEEIEHLRRKKLELVTHMESTLSTKPIYQFGLNFMLASEEKNNTQ